METRRYAYNYAQVELDTGRCTGLQDTTNYILRRDYIPVDKIKVTYLDKYYHPVPESVSSFDDFQGRWYTSSTYETEWTPD